MILIVDRKLVFAASFDGFIICVSMLLSVYTQSYAEDSCMRGSTLLIHLVDLANRRHFFSIATTLPEE